MSLKVDTTVLDEMAASMADPEIEEKLMGIAQERGVLAIISQAVADNFAKEGPGWAPLRAKTIRASLSKALRKKIRGMSDKDLEKNERMARMPLIGMEDTSSYRQILRRTSLLFKTATTPGFSGSSVGGRQAMNEEQRGKKKRKEAGKVVSGSNIYRVEGTNIIYGTDLVYAATHNRGDASRNIPKREFLRIRPEWMRDIEEYFVRRAEEIIRVIKGIQK